ncbi:Polyphenol oxidase 2 [Leucoagaricus sp. SymC.cos]|nr:Polyphenol oxidase 2 [Leucoagaricus sp. SymC.cos]
MFWLHRANVDRLLSLWSPTHPDVRVTPGKNLDITMNLATGTNVTQDIPLTPFYTSKDRAWTSANLADTSQPGYSCPEFDKLVGGSKEHIRYPIDDFVDKHYGSRRLPGLAQAVTNPGFTSQVYADELEMLDWVIHVTFRKFELNDSSTILFYLGTDGGDTHQSENYAGTINTFHELTPETCANCKNNKDMAQQGFIHLDQYIARDKGSFEPNAVMEYLKGKKLSRNLFTGDEKPLTFLKVS